MVSFANTKAQDFEFKQVLSSVSSVFWIFIFSFKSHYLLFFLESRLWGYLFVTEKNFQDHYKILNKLFSSILSQTNSILGFESLWEFKKPITLSAISK